MVNFRKSKWTSLFFSNFLGVYNDNLLKNSVIFIAIAVNDDITGNFLSL